MLLKMIREEWRKNSAMYKGRSFAAFPVMVFFFSFAWNWTAINYSTIPIQSLETFTYMLIAFVGLGVGAVGFSSRDAFRNILGRTNYIVFTSRTLPVSSRKLLALFTLKDMIYYAFLVLVPLISGFVFGTGNITQIIYLGPLLFLSAIILSTLFTSSSLKIPFKRILNYKKLERLEPVASKSVMDVSRSSGGFFKIIFSIGILTAFYWTLVLYFPVTSIFLSNPLLSFSVILGLVGLTVYNWLNRFDGVQDYTHLPVDSSKILKAKKEAYMYTALPLILFTVVLSMFFYADNILLSLFTATSMTVYNMAVAVHFTGLTPNESLFHTDIFLKYLIGLSVLLVPQLYLSVAYTVELLPWMLGINILALLIGLYSYRK